MLLQKEDLKIGMIVKREQLTSILGVFIYFKDYDDIKGGEIWYICEEPDDFVTNNIIKSGKVLTFYQDKDYKNGVEFYD